MTASPTIGLSRDPASSVSRTDLSTRMEIVWHRGKTKINRLLGNAPLETRTAYESTCVLPYEIVEMIAAHLRDLEALKACSSTCRSWHIAAAPYLHHTITLRENGPDVTRNRLKPLSKLHKLGLMALIKEVRVGPAPTIDPWFIPQAFSLRDLQYFSAFTKVQTLKLARVAIDRFIPGNEPYFEHFSPTLKSMTLYYPHCTPRQLSHFLSLFSNLDNIKISGIDASAPETTTLDTELIPFTAHKPRGQLVLHHFHPIEACTYLTSCGGPRFHYMDLYDIGRWTPVLLEACAETLETLRLNLTDAPAVGYSRSLLPEFDLSRLEVLRSLQVGAWLADLRPEDYSYGTVMKVFSTITSPVFSELVIVIAGHAIIGLPWEVTFFETLGTMSETRPFKLVFLLEDSDFDQREAPRELTEALDSVVAKGFLDFLDSPPTIRRARAPLQGGWDMSFPDFG